MKNGFTRKLCGTAAAAALLVLPGVAAAGLSAEVRAMHLSPDAPPVDVLVNDTTRAITDLTYPNSSQFVPLSGQVNFDFDIVPAGEDVSESVLAINDFSIEGGAAYTLVAFNELSNIQPLALEEDLSVPAAGNIRVRAVHTAAAAGQVDILVLGDTATPLFEDLDFGSASQFAEVPEGQYSLGLDLNNDAIPELRFDLPDLAAGSIANVYAVSDESGVFLVAQFPEGTTARIDAAAPANLRAMHLSPNAPTVDVLVNSTLRALSRLDFPNGSDYAALAAGTYDLDVVPTGDNVEDSVLNVSGLPLEAGASYTAVAFNTLDSIQALALRDDLTTPTAGNIRVRVAHTAAGVGQVDVITLPGQNGQLFSDLDFGAFTNYAEVPAGQYNLGLDTNNDEIAEFRFELPELPAGIIATVYAVNDSGTIFLVAQLADGSTVRIDAAAPANVRALHLSPGAPTVDVLVNGSLRAFEGLDFPNGTAYAALGADEYTFDIVPTTQDVSQSVLNIPDLALDPGMNYTAVAFNTVDSIQALALVDDFDNLMNGFIRLRAAHTAAGVGEVDILVGSAEGFMPLFPDVAFGEVTDYGDVPAGSYTIGLDANDDSFPEFVFNTPELAAGTVANVFAVNDNGAVFLLAQLQDGTTVRIDPTTPDGFAFGFNTGAQGWSFGSTTEFTAPDSNTNDERLALVASDNTSTFGFWDSPVFNIAGNNNGRSIYRVDATLASDQSDASLVPTARVRVAAQDHSQASVLVVTSEGDGSLSPTTAGKSYTSYLALAEVAPLFLSFDLLNFISDNAASAVLALDSISVSLDGGSDFANESEVVNLSFLNSETNGFTNRTVPGLAAPNFAATSRGLAISGNANRGVEATFGFWGIETEVPYTGGALYGIRYTVGSDASSEQVSNLPAFRLRINDSSFKSSAYLNIESTASFVERALPTDGQSETYELLFRAPAEIDGTNWIFSFDYLFSPTAENDPSLTLYLENLQVVQYSANQ